ncbi:MAG: RimK family alpha-L-glutamate ligase [Leptospiraceae bacterium]|nr:RimK family alpha-L-glutamate ligase [Leptospiraceae bacterium]MDW8307391.1 RimK family alpha-L-glutamate ligase [Leptospiraceae bacterium]
MIVHILSNSRSLYSTRRLFEEAFKRGHKVRVYPPVNLALFIDKNVTQVFFQREALSRPDVVIPRLGQKKPNYTLAVLRQFEMMGVATLNGSQAMGRCRDKLRTLQILAQHNIPVPKTFFLDSLSDIELAIEMVGGPPLIIKLPEGSQGMGVMLAETVPSARSILEALLNQGLHVLVQEFIAESRGSDIRVIILGGKMIAAMRRISLSNDFRSNVHRGASTEKVNLSYEARRTAQQASRILGLQFAGVDVMESHRGPLVLEVNPSPGLEGIENASGVNVALAVIEYLEKLHRLQQVRDSVGY